MKFYDSIATDDCFRIAICNILQIPPNKVPHFIKKHDHLWIEAVRKWLRKYNRAIVYVPLNAFLTDYEWNLNASQIFPDGLCIVSLLKNKKELHTEVMVDGKIISEMFDAFDTITGYFIIYDLYPKKLKLK